MHFDKLQPSPKKEALQPALKAMYVGKQFKAFLEVECCQLFDTAFFESPVTAVAHAQQLSAFDLPQVVFCDEQISSRIDYLAFYQEWSAKPSMAKVPVIVLSENATRAELQRARAVGLADFIQLPTPTDRVKIRVESLLELRRLKAVASDVQGESLADYQIPLSKRLFDIVVASTILLMISPLLALIAVLIRLESRGPIFYISKRTGTGYRLINFLKFRSMRVGADKEIKNLQHLNQYAKEKKEETQKFPEFKPCKTCAQLNLECQEVLYFGATALCEKQYKEMKKAQAGSTFVKFENDPRVTRIGKFIRNTSIDELPQLFNVLKGDMSIVGNRPLPLYEAEQLTSDQSAKRFLAPAGITGLWQVTKRGKGGDMSEEERKQLDNIYAEKSSFWFDVKILLMTVPALFQKENV